MMSGRFTPAAFMRIRSSPGPGLGVGTLEAFNASAGPLPPSTIAAVMVLGIELTRAFLFTVASALGTRAIAEIAMARAAHDGLGSRQLDARIVALAERPAAIAGEDVADVAKSHGAIGLRVAAAPDVEVEHAGPVVDELDRQRVVLRPERQGP